MESKSVGLPDDWKVANVVPVRPTTATNKSHEVDVYVIMAALCNRGIIFLPCSFFLLLSSIFYLFFLA